MTHLHGYYTAIIFLVLFSMLVMQLFVGRSNTFTSKRKVLFRLLFAVIALAAFCEWLGNTLQGAPQATRILHIAVKACELSIAPSIGFLFAWILDDRRHRPVWTLLGIHALAECLSGFFGFIYCVDGNNVYFHAPFYFIYVGFYLFSALYCLVAVLRNVKKYQYSGSGIFLVIVIGMIAGIFLQLVDSSLKVAYLSVAVATIMAYVFTVEMIQQTDELTELLNRRGFENCIWHMEKPCIVAFFDVDNFKQINDNYGHAFGDHAVRKIGSAIKKVYAPYGKCFRYGGDEFCVILEKELEQIETFNTTFFSEMEIQRAEETNMPSVSVGYADYTPGQNNITDVVHTADEMMYRFKQLRKKQPLQNG